MRKVLAAIAVAAMLIGVVGVTMYLITHSGAQEQAAPDQSWATPTATVPTPGEFLVAVQVTDQHCATANTCTYVYSIQPEYRGMHPLPTTPFTVYYEVVGGQKPQPGSFTVHDGQARMLQGVAVDGPKNAKLDAKVTRVAAIEGPMPVTSGEVEAPVSTQPEG